MQWVAVSPDRRLLAAAGDDGTLRLWNVAAPGHPVLVGDLLAADARIRCTRRSSARTANCSRPRARTGVVTGCGTCQGPRAVPVHPSAARRAGQRVLACVQPRFGDARRGQHRRHGPAVARRRPGAAHRGRHAAGHSADLPELGRVQPRRPDARGRHRARARSGYGACQVRPPWPGCPGGTAGMPLRGPAARSPASPSARTGGSSPPPARTSRSGCGGSPTAAWSPRHADRGDQLGEHRRVQPGRQVGGGRDVRANVLVWNVRPGEVTAMLPHPQPVTSVTWDGPDRVVAGGADGAVSLWSLPSSVITVRYAAYQLAYSPDGTTLAVGGSRHSALGHCHPHPARQPVPGTEPIRQRDASSARSGRARRSSRSRSRTERLSCSTAARWRRSPRRSR